jgi:hypothetical protein
MFVTNKPFHLVVRPLPFSKIIGQEGKGLPGTNTLAYLASDKEILQTFSFHL